MKKNLTIALFYALLISILAFLLSIVLNIEGPKTEYEIKELESSMKINESTPLYVASIPFNGIADRDAPYLYLFREDDGKAVDVFLYPEYVGTRLVAERYYNVFKSSHYTSSTSTVAFDHMFRLAGKTSEENPLVLVRTNGVLYGVIDGTAYILEDNSVMEEASKRNPLLDQTGDEGMNGKEQKKKDKNKDKDAQSAEDLEEDLKELRAGEFRKIDEIVVYKLNYNGQFELLVPEEEKEREEK